MKKIILLLPFLLLLNCSVQKRKYQNGFYVDWSSKTGTVSDHQLAKTPSVERRRTPASIDERLIPSGEPPAEKKVTLAEPLRSFTKLDADSCDEIIFRDGTEVKAKVFEISSSTIKYKRCGLEEGPTYVAKRSEIFMIKYANGTREVFKEEAPPPPPPQYNQPSKPPTEHPKNYSQGMTVLHPAAAGAFALALISFLLFFVPAASAGVIFLVILGASIGARLGLKLARKALYEINNNSERYHGRGLAKAARVISIIVLSLLALIGILVILAILRGI